MFEDDERSYTRDDIEETGRLEQKKVYNFDGQFEAKSHHKLKKRGDITNTEEERNTETTTTTLGVECDVPDCDDEVEIFLPRADRCGCY